MKFTRKTWLAIVAGALLASPVAIAADHTDGSAATGEPTADITDLFAWMSDENNIGTGAGTFTMIMDVTKAATTASLFSDTVKYVFHTNSHGPTGGVFPGVPVIPVLGGTTDPEVDTICTFTGTAVPQTIQCWVTGATPEYVTGTASMTTPLKSADGLVTIYAGLASDPFFFNLTGFKNVAATVTAVKGTLTFDAAGCPILPPADVTLLDGQLTSGADGGVPLDDFYGLNVLAIVVQLDSSLVVDPSIIDMTQTPPAPGDTLVSVWASTNN